MDALGAHAWPGNVRELQNVVERACALSESHVIRRQDLPSHIEKLVEADDTGVETGFIEKADETEVSQNVFPLERENDSGIPAEGQDLAAISANGPLKPLKQFLRDQEVAYLNRVMTHTGGDKEEASKILEVSLATLYRKLSEEEN
jgi:DNA-binding NtrC family response regulator